MKTVVEPEARIELDDAGELRRAHLHYELNEYDRYAAEEAIRLAEAGGAEVTVMSVGPDEVVQGLRKGLAMGATNAIHVRTEGDLADAAASAKVLAAALRDRAPDLVFTGVESEDLGGSQVGALLAEELGYSCVSMTIATEVGNPPDTIRIRRELEGGNYVDVAVRLPAVLTVQTGINEPRYPSLKGIMESKRKEMSVFSLSDLGFSEPLAPLVETVSLEYPPPRQRARMMAGSTDEVVDELLRVLREEEKVL